MQETKPHAHAELYIIWIKDTNTKFQFKHDHTQGWRDVVGHPMFHDKNEYRLKPVATPHYYIAYELISGERGLSQMRYPSADKYKARTNHLRYKWVAIVPDTLIMEVADE